MNTDTSERGLERLICTALTGSPCDPGTVVPKLPAPDEEDLSKGSLEAIDVDSYRVEKQAAVKIQLSDTDAEIEPVPTTGHRPEAELDRLSNIPQCLQRPVRQHPVERRRPCSG